MRGIQYSEQVVEEFCRRLAGGKGMIEVCSDEDMPSWSTIWTWRKDKPGVAAQIDAALELGTHAMAHECLRIADSAHIDVRNKRVMIDTRIKLIGKWNRRQYGDHVQVDQTTTLQGMSDAELDAQIKQQLMGLKARGFDVDKLLNE